MKKTLSDRDIIGKISTVVAGKIRRGELSRAAGGRIIAWSAAKLGVELDDHEIKIVSSRVRKNR